MPKVLRNPDVLWRRESENAEEVASDDTVAAILFSGGAMLSVNELGIEIWQLCDGRTVDDLIKSLLSQYDVDEAVLRADVQDFLDSLLQKGFIRYE